MADFKEVNLTVAGEVAGFTKDACGFLCGVESHGVFGIDEINAPTGFALIFPDRCELDVGIAIRPGLFDVGYEFGEGVKRAVHQLGGAVLDGGNTLAE